MNALSEVHKEFIRSHLRYQSLRGVEPTDGIAEDVLQQVTEVQDRLTAAVGVGNNDVACRKTIRCEYQLQINDKINNIHNLLELKNFEFSSPFLKSHV